MLVGFVVLANFCFYLFSFCKVTYNAYSEMNTVETLMRDINFIRLPDLKENVFQ